jgi:lambda repressor-like predicted transcriptional regulator
MGIHTGVVLVDLLTVRHLLAREALRDNGRKGISLAAVADFAGVSRRQLYNFLSGEHDITRGWLSKVADALEVEPADLLQKR